MEAYPIINYAPEDEAFALRLYENLHNAGQTAWIDRHDVRQDEHWHQAINRALQTCTHMLLVWTKNAESSREIESEWVYFMSQGKPIILILNDHHPVHYSLERYMALDFTRDQAGALRRLLNQLHAAQADPEAAVLALEQGNAAYNYDYRRHQIF
jgi:hypothetical protein